MRWLKIPLSVSAAVSGLLLSLASVVLAAVVALALWSGTEGSLARGLQALSLLLPAGQSLRVSGVQGSLQAGGRLAEAHWQMDGLRVDVEGLELGWDWHTLLRGEWQLGSLHAHLLRISDQRPATHTPLTELVLPQRLDIRFAVDQLDWDGPPALRLQQVQGHYRFDGQQHVLRDASLQMADGRYQLSGQVQAHQPMAVQLHAKGLVQAPLHLQKKALALRAEASAQGTLAGPEATVAVALDLQPQDSARSPLGAMQAHGQLQWRPAQAQPIASAQGQFTALDLARLWPQAPQTLLSGQFQLQPDGAGWQASLRLQNALAGPLNQQRLPVQSADAKLRYQQGQWQLSDGQAALAGGSLQAHGVVAGNAAQWQLQASLQGVQAGLLDTRSQGLAALAGELQAQQGVQGIAFVAQLHSASAASGKALQAQAKGRWLDHVLQLEQLHVQGPQAQLDGQLRVDMQNLAASGQIKATLPGAQWQLSGDAAPATGAGQLQAQVSDAGAVLRWLRQWPWLAPQLPTGPAQGSASLAAHWSGGWRDQGSGLQMQLSLKAQQLALDGAPLLDDTQLELSGSPRALRLQWQGRGQAAGVPLQGQAGAQLGWQGPGQWHATLEQLTLNSGEAKAAWTVQLQAPVLLDWQQAGARQSLALGAGALRMTGPVPGTARLQWQAGQWSQSAKPGAPVESRWSSRGQLDGLPLVWLEWLGQTRLANLGLRGDLLFAGQWEASRAADGLHLRAGLQRSGGDLQLLAAEPGKPALAAGTREARVALSVDNTAVRATLVWASALAGTAQAELNTQLQWHDGALQWPANAALQGHLQASLPRVGVWSVLAPVGWRIQGTVQADATLGGNRTQPDWHGTLQARELSLRSVVDGIDFSQGQIRLLLNGQRLDIAELSLQGAGGASGGQLLASGVVDWLPGAPGSPLAARLRMALDAQARSLRVTARPDQRLVVSGQLTARLTDARFSVRGALVADQALLVLPEDTAPHLGADVVVQRGKPSAAAAKASVATSRLSPALRPDLLITLDPGSNFQLQGHGINTSLSGLLTLKTEGPDAQPRLQGELHTVNGTYRAYGQRLNIEEGRLRFSGAYDNPALDIRAVRPNVSQVVGVQISGTAQLPVVRLFAEPDLPDADKLSWLLLGRASSNGGGEAAMLQQAAVALLSSNRRGPGSQITDAIGLDEVSLGQVATTNLDGTSGSEATVKLGKRLSRDFYVAYERSLAGAMGTFYVFYDLSRRFTLRGESGTQNAVDLIFTTRFD